MPACLLSAWQPGKMHNLNLNSNKIYAAFRRKAKRMRKYGKTICKLCCLAGRTTEQPSSHSKLPVKFCLTSFWPNQIAEEELRAWEPFGDCCSSTRETENRRLSCNIAWQAIVLCGMLIFYVASSIFMTLSVSLFGQVSLCVCLCVCAFWCCVCRQPGKLQKLKL